MRNEANLRLSTDDWPEPERRAAVSDLLRRTLWAADYDPLPDNPVYIDGRFRALPGLGVADVTCSGRRTARRTQEHLNDAYLLSILLCGTATMRQCGREITIGPGEAALTSGAEPGERAVSASRLVMYRVPAKALAPLLSDLEDRVAQPIRGPALQLLTAYASMLYGSRAVTASAEVALAVKHAYDLVALALGPGKDAEEAARGGARAARLAAVKADILNNLASDLSIAAVAARHRLPVRYVQRLFEGEGLSFTGYVVEQRLLRAYRMLSDPSLSGCAVGTIAFESGFGHLPYFNRAFRSRFGETPTGVRAQARNH